MSMPHICTIPHETSETFLPYTDLDKNIFHKIRRKFKNATMVWKNHPQISQYYRSKTSYLEERKKEFQKKCSLVIHPLSFFWFCAEIVLTISYMVAFIYFPMYGLAPNAALVKIIEELRLLEFILLCEIFVRFFVGRLDEKHGNVDMNHCSIIRSYLLSFAFVADFCGGIPLYMIKTLGWEIPNPYATIRCLKFWRLLTFFKNCENFWKKLNVQEFSTVTRILVIILLFFHWTTFLLFNVTDAKASSPNLLIHDDELNSETMTFEQYLRTAWRAVGLLLSAHSIVTIQSKLQEKVASVVFLMLGKLSVMIFAVAFINQILRMSELETKYQGILNQLHEFMAQRKLPMTTRERILTFYEYKFQKKYVRERNINSILSDRLKREINFHTTNKLLNTVTMFEDIPSDIVAEILSNLRMEMYLPNDVIVKAGSPTDSMYFIANGTVSVTTASGREVCHLHDGAYFGEACLVLNYKKSISNVTALEICETYRLFGKTFRRCLREHQDVLTKLRKEAEEREKKTQDLENEFQEKLFQKTFVRSQTSYEEPE
ncbi:hypothetical protein WA026_001948 [Henosepilachna vigintioctopunctata]|uniref:Cyclic nucleotide-binding domain-containing protein n=1 Tax=Henosepilachna vigintioctopunctata TaxID=420089 RepID=A0AAW1UUW0_9CUCU